MDTVTAREGDQGTDIDREPVEHTGRDHRWRRADGLALLGAVQGSGLRDEMFLVRRRDDQVVQLSELLHLVLIELDPERSPSEVAAAVSAAYGRTLNPEGLAHLVTTRLEPLGLVEDEATTGPPPQPRSNPLLALTLKGTLLPPPVTRRLARWLQHLYWPPVVVVVVVSLVALDVVVATNAGFWDAVTQLFATPTLALVMYGMVTAGSVIHELGHAAACRYGGAEPGTIGFGLYLVFPAFYTDVTDSYRLSRAGRVRTDLGGLYFNALCVLALGGAFLVTGHGIFLLTAVVMQVQMLQQLIPVVRFDGYYVLSDLAGVPDLFARVGPVLRSLRPGRPPDPRVAELRPRARRLVVGWVLVVVPTLALALLWFLWSLPDFVARARDGIEIQQEAFAAAWPGREIAMLVLSVLSVALILLPLLGVAVTLWKLAASLGRLAVRRSRRSNRKEETMAADLEPETRYDVPAAPPLSAAAFTDAHMLPARSAAPTLGWRGAVYRASGHRINPGRSAEQLRKEALERRLRTPVEGSRRVVVMSRKGGVGKTTMTLALGSAFAVQRGDRVVAVDANPDAGNLAHRVAPPHDRNLTHLLRDLDDITSYAALRTYTVQAPESRLEVLASDDDPRIGMALDRNDYHRLIDLLDHFYNLILLDTGTGILDSANQGLLGEADQVVLVLGPGLDGGRAAALTLDWMDEHGFEELVSRTVVVINGLHKEDAGPTVPMRRHFEKRCARVLAVPWDPELEAGAQTAMSSLRPRTRDSLVEVAAAVADNFREIGARR